MGFSMKYVAPTGAGSLKIFYKIALTTWNVSKIYLPSCIRYLHLNSIKVAITVIKMKLDNYHFA